MDRNYLFLKILTRGTRISILKNDLTTRSSIKVDLKFSTLVPSIENQWQNKKKARNYLFLKILTRGTRISVLKNDPTTGSTLKVDLKFSTLVPSIDNQCKIENGQKLLILEDLDTRNTNIGFKKRSDHGKYVKSRFEVFDTSAIY